MRWLAQNPPNLQGVGEALDCIVRDGNRAADVVGRIRSLLRKNSPPMVNLDINEVIREVLVLTNDEIERRGIVVETELAADLPVALGDRVQLQQVMLNLIMNSLDAMANVPEGSRELKINSSTSPDSVLVEVLDSGCGLPNHRSGAIFDPFFTTKEKGIGMGLTISRSIIEAHGGRLWAEQRSPKGAVLNFTLPRRASGE
jgi:C4-dicarboxylate-specific signal transduction histidine kinase